MTKQDYLDWKRHPVTQQIFSQLQDRVEYYKQVLADNAGRDSYQDAKHSGYILGLSDVLETRPEEDESGS